MEPDERTEATRLEGLWSGEFGDEYVDRNLAGYEHRGDFWTSLHSSTDFQSVLEIGCNVGGNLRWLAPLLEDGKAFGVDINRKAIATAQQLVPAANILWSPARELPFRDRWFDLVFTMGVLIHQPEATLPLVMNEMVRCAKRYVLCAEYFDESTTEVPYRGHEGALFRRDFGGIFHELFPDLEVVERGFLSRSEGWDDVTWWLFRRP